MSIGIRPFFQRLCETITGPDPRTYERQLKNERIAELQRTINQAVTVQRLLDAPGWKEYVERVRGKRDEKVKALCRANAKECVAIQASIAAYTDVLEMMTDEVDAANAARKELDEMIDEEMQ